MRDAGLRKKRRVKGADVSKESCDMEYFSLYM